MPWSLISSQDDIADIANKNHSFNFHCARLAYPFSYDLMFVIFLVYLIFFDINLGKTKFITDLFWLSINHNILFIKIFF